MLLPYCQIVDTIHESAYPLLCVLGVAFLGLSPNLFSPSRDNKSCDPLWYLTGPLG